MYIKKKNFNLDFEIYILDLSFQKIYKLNQEIQQIDNKKNFKKNSHIWIIIKFFGQIINYKF